MSNKIKLFFEFAIFYTIRGTVKLIIVDSSLNIVKIKKQSRGNFKRKINISVQYFNAFRYRRGCLDKYVIQ